MTSRVEAEGNSIDEAIENALAELGVSRDEARVEILQDARRGLFGLGGQKARVAVTRRAKAGLGSDPDPAPDPAPRAPAAPTPPRPDRRATPRNPEGKARADDRGDAPPKSESRRRGEDRRPAPAPAPAADAPPAAAPEEAVAVLGEILRRMELDARVEPAPAQSDGHPVLQIATAHGALVIGRHGQTLDALEYLVNRIIGKQEERGSRIVVDCEGYRERHRRELEDTAKRLAEKVRDRGKSQTMTPMNPRDRRIVHVTLAGQDDVVTRSVGQGYLRRIVIAPARGNRAASSRS